MGVLVAGTEAVCVFELWSIAVNGSLNIRKYPSALFGLCLSFMIENLGWKFHKPETP